MNKLAQRLTKSAEIAWTEKEYWGCVGVVDSFMMFARVNQYADRYELEEGEESSWFLLLCAEALSE
jgi:hypothetical protein